MCYYYAISYTWVVIIMIKRECYMQRIRPFIGSDLIKVLTGIRRSGKSVMLDLIKEELKADGVSDSQFISFNFESLANARYCTAEALYEELTNRISTVRGKAYLFFDEIQEVRDWEKCVNSARVDFDPLREKPYGLSPAVSSATILP